MAAPPSSSPAASFVIVILSSLAFTDTPENYDAAPAAQRASRNASVAATPAGKSAEKGWGLKVILLDGPARVR
jgi:hypothetical protein